MQKRPAVQSFSLALTAAFFLLLGVPAAAVDMATWTTDRTAANQIWGNIDNFSSPTDANYFGHYAPVGMGARPIGMGQAFVGLADELSAVWWNPAGLTQQPTNEVHWMGGDRDFSDAPYSGFISVDYILDNHMAFAFSYERPYHPVGKYPDMLVANKPFASQVSGFWGNFQPGTKIAYNDIADTAVQDVLAKEYRAWINLPFQEDDYVLTYATPLSGGENLSMGINVKYMTQDADYAVDGITLNEIQGWGADLGFLYRLPLSHFGNELGFGLDLRDLASQVKYDTSREFTLPCTSTLGVAWKTSDFLTRDKLNLDADFVYINDPGLDGNSNHQLNLGAEMWFFKGHIGPRAGWDFLFDQPSQGSLGFSLRYMLEFDYAYIFPAQNESDGSHWFSLSLHWGGPKRNLPVPDVACTVDPPIFAPRNGELATFTLSAESKNGIDRWTLNIIDRNNQVVKSYSDRGDAPAQILWGGEDKTYRLLPDGEYTFLFTATDNAGASSSTPVQTLKIFTPPVVQATRGDLDKLRALIVRQNDSEEAVDQKLRTDVSKQLAQLINQKNESVTLPPLVKAPEAPKPVSPSAIPGAPGNSTPAAFAFPTVNDLPMPRTQLVTDPTGKKAYVVEYATAQTMPRYILNDATDVIRVSARDLGESVATYDVRADYGNRVLRVVSPAATALNYAHGFIKAEQLLNASVVTLDGEAIQPLYR